MASQFIPRQIHVPTGLEIITSGDGSVSRDCPTCHQKTALTKKTLSKVSLQALRLMYEEYEGTITPSEVSERLGKSAYANYTELRHWGFIADGTVERKGKRVAGWGITPEGIAFLKGDLWVPAHLWVYNGAARIVPEHLRGGLVNYAKVVPYVEMSREKAAAESVALDATGQESINL